MRNSKALFLALALNVGPMALGVSANYGDKQYSLTVNDQRGFNISSDAGAVKDSVLVFVYNAGTKTLSTIYGDRKHTTKANPISTAQFATDKGVVFFGPNSTYDLFIAHTDGSVASVTGVTPLIHRISLNRTDTHRTLVLPFTNNGTTEVSTGVKLPYDSMVTDVAVQVVTAEASKTVSVGLLSSESGGSATGFVNAASTTTAGYPVLSVFTTGSNETFFASSTLGSFLFSGDAGADTALHYGSYFRQPKVITGTGAQTVSYTGSSGSTTAAGYIYLFFRLLR